MSQKPEVIPLVVQPENRDYNTNKDSKIVNAIAERQVDGTIQVSQRPGILWKKHIASVTPATLRGAISYKGYNHVVMGNVFTVYDSSLNTISSAIIAVPWASTWYSMTAVTRPTGVPHLGDTWQILLLSDSKGYVFDSTSPGVLTDITASLNGSGSFAYGVVTIDNTVYYMDTNSVIYGSNISDLTTWNALNKISVGGDSDSGTALNTQLNYLVVFKTTSIEFLYDAGNPSGSPLARSEPAHISSMGCRASAALSIVNFGGKIIWQYYTKTGAKGFAMMEGLQCRVISTPSIERLLGSVEDTTAVSYTSNGHTYYVVRLLDAGITLVYDLTQDLWYQWYTDATGTSSTYFPFGAVLDVWYGKVLVHESNGSVYTVSQTKIGDEIASGTIVPVTSTIVTPRWNGGTQLKKYCPRTEVHTDINASSTMLLQVTDDDYVTWDSGRSMDLSLPNNTLINCGTFRRRAYKLTHSSLAPFRVTGLEIRIMYGST